MAERAGVEDPEMTDGEADAERPAASSTARKAGEAPPGADGGDVDSWPGAIKTGWASSLVSEGNAGEL